MLSLYRKFITSNDTKSLEKLAEETWEYYRKNARKDIEKVKPYSNSNDTMHDITSILINTCGNIPYLEGVFDAIASSAYMSIVMKFLPENAEITQLAYTFLSTFPIGNSIDCILRYLGIPEGYIHSVSLVLFSLYFILKNFL